MTFLAAGQAVGLQLSVAQGALLTSGVALATIVPSGPGYVGTFELTVVALTHGLRIPPHPAFAMGPLLHLMIPPTPTVRGAVAPAAPPRPAGPAHAPPAPQAAQPAPPP